MSDVSVSRRSFNPANPGNTGKVRLAFTVSGPGTGRLEVIDPTGRVVDTVTLPTFDTWNQVVQWPKDSFPGDATLLRPGTYELHLALQGEDGRPDTHTATVEIDPSLVVRYRSLWHNGAGLLYAHAPTPLPPGNIQTSLLVAGIATELDGDRVIRFPGKLGVRIGAGSGFEVAVSAGLIAHSQPLLDRWLAGASVTYLGTIWAEGRSELSAGVVAGGSYRTPNTAGLYAGPDTLTDFPGLFAAVPVKFGWGPLTLSIAPEIRYAVAPITYDATVPANGWTPYLYGRAGALLDTGGATVGLSGAVRSAPLTSGLSLELPFQVGGEFHWFVPNSTVVLTALFAGEFENLRDFYIMGGGGIAVLF